MKFKVKGLVFVGFAAAILSANAMAADSTVTSKSYVDSKYVGGTGITTTTPNEGVNAGKIVFSVSGDGDLTAYTSGNTDTITVSDHTITAVTTGGVAADGSNLVTGGQVDSAITVTGVKLQGDDNALTPTNKIVTIPDYDGATANGDGTHGLVPAAASANRDKFLKGDGTWADPANTTYTADDVTIELDGTQFKAKTAAVSATNQQTLTTGGQVYDYVTVKGVQLGNDTALTPNATTKVVTIPDYAGATANGDGTHGLVPAATTATKDMFLRGDGTWATPADTTYTADGTTITLNNGQFSATAGSIADGNTGLINGDAVYDYLNVKASGATCSADAPCALVLAGGVPTWQPIQQ